MSSIEASIDVIKAYSDIFSFDEFQVDFKNTVNNLNNALLDNVINHIIDKCIDIRKKFENFKLNHPANQ